MADFPQFERIRNKKSGGWLAFFLFVSVGLYYKIPSRAMRHNLCLAKQNISREHIYLIFPKGWLVILPINQSALNCYQTFPDFTCMILQLRKLQNRAQKKTKKQQASFFFFLKQLSFNWFTRQEVIRKL